MKIAVNFIAMLIVMPIWWYLMYKILQGVNASELMWFLFWIYIPSSLIVRVLQTLIEREAKALEGK
jgi:hypothetical protein